MADTEIRLPGIPAGLTASVRVRDLDDLTVLETVALSESGDYYTGDVTGAHEGSFLFELLISGVAASTVVRSIADDAGPYVVQDGLDDVAELAAIRKKTDQIGSVTFLASGNTVSSDGSIVIKAGDRHVFTLTSDYEDAVPDLTGVTVRFGIKGNGGAQLLTTTAVTVLVATGLQSVEIALTPAETILLSSGQYHFDLQAEYSATDHQTFVTGSVTVKADYSGVPG